RCHRALADAGLETRLVLQIHDELLFEGPEAEIDAAAEIVREEMVAAFDLDPPLVVAAGIGRDWLEVKYRRGTPASGGRSRGRRAARDARVPRRVGGRGDVQAGAERHAQEPRATD